MKKAAVFNDLSGFGKCSLTAAIPVLSAQGVQCCPMASAVLTNQTGYEYHKCTDLTAMIKDYICLLYTSPSPRDVEESRMPSSA